jgi:hypothetical protein
VTSTKVLEDEVVDVWGSSSIVSATEVLTPRPTSEHSMIEMYLLATTSQVRNQSVDGGAGVGGDEMRTSIVAS